METSHLIVKLKLLLSSAQDSMPEKVHYSNPRLCVPKAALRHHSALFNVGILMMDMSGNPAGGNRLASGPRDNSETQLDQVSSFPAPPTDCLRD